MKIKEIDKAIIQHFRDNYEECVEFIVENTEDLSALGLFASVIVEDREELLIQFVEENSKLYDELIAKEFFDDVT